jgi:hypothetical protein
MKDDDAVGGKSAVESGQAAIQVVNSEHIDSAELGEHIQHPALNIVPSEPALDGNAAEERLEGRPRRTGGCGAGGGGSSRDGGRAGRRVVVHKSFKHRHGGAGEASHAVVGQHTIDGRQRATELIDGVDAKIVELRKNSSRPCAELGLRETFGCRSGAEKMKQGGSWEEVDPGVDGEDLGLGWRGVVMYACGFHPKSPGL